MCSPSDALAALALAQPIAQFKADRTFREKP